MSPEQDKAMQNSLVFKERALFAVVVVSQKVRRS